MIAKRERYPAVGVSDRACTDPHEVARGTHCIEISASESGHPHREDVGFQTRSRKHRPLQHAENINKDVSSAPAITSESVPLCEESRQRVISTPVPDFARLNPEIEPKLNQILQRSLARDLSQRYQTADELLYELEHLIYHKGYGPTNETLGKFNRELFGQLYVNEISAARGNTLLIQRPDKLPPGAA